MVSVAPVSAPVAAKLAARGRQCITGSTLTINNTANAGNFTTVGDVSTGSCGGAQQAHAGRPRDAQRAA